jgi:hypothetical protein
MFIDRVIEEIMKNKTYEASEKLVDGKVIPKRIVKWSHYLDAIKNSLCFDVTNVYEYITRSNGSKDIRSNDFPNIRPPASEVWLEWKLLGRNEWIKTAGGILFTEKQGEELLAIYVGFIEQKTGEIDPIPPLEFYIGLDGTILSEKLFKFNGKKWTEEKFLNTPAKLFFNPLFLSLSFMNCKNIERKENSPSTKIQKKRENKNRFPLVTYHVLEIRSITKILREQGKSDSLGIKHALHICRGHFKDYNKGKGLFGKYKGLYWWDMHTRGSVDEGVVVKDYKVSPPTETI